MAIDYKDQVIPRLKFMGKNGDPEAYFELGKRYELGFKYECCDQDSKDEDLALEYYLKACNLDISYYIELGKRYLYPKAGGFQQNAIIAFNYFRETGEYLYNRKELLIMHQATLLNLYLEGVNHQAIAKEIFRNIKSMQDSNKGKYNYYFDAADVLYYGLAGKVDLFNALKLYYFGLKFLIQTFLSENYNCHIKARTTKLFSFHMDDILERLIRLIKQINPDELNKCHPSYEIYGIPDLNIDECITNNSKYALFKAGIAYEYGLANLTRDLDEAMRLYHESLKKGCYEAGYKLMLLLRGKVEQVYHCFRDTLLAVVEKMISIIKYQIEESNIDLRILKKFLYELEDYEFYY